MLEDTDTDGGYTDKEDKDTDTDGGHGCGIQLLDTDDGGGHSPLQQEDMDYIGHTYSSALLPGLRLCSLTLLPGGAVNSLTDTDTDGGGYTPGVKDDLADGTSI